MKTGNNIPAIGILIIILIFSFIYSCEKTAHLPGGNCALQENTDTMPQFLKILFIGNSHTYTHDIPGTIAQMANSRGDSIKKIRTRTPGGYTLKQHSRSESTLKAIKSEKWDYVVLQGVGWLQALPVFMADTAIYQYAEILIDSIKNNSPETQIILYMTHGYREGVLSFDAVEWCEEDPVVCNCEGMLYRVKENYLKMAELFDVEIAPSGMMWKIFGDKYPGINLYQDDGAHASHAGSYIAACCIYSLIFKKKSVNNYFPSNVDKDVARNIQTVVSNSLFDCNPDWHTYTLKY